MGCCDDTQCAIEIMRDDRQRNTLWVVLVLNAVMFVVEAVAGLRALQCTARRFAGYAG